MGDEGVAAVFGDGGVVKANPSPIGGSWAWIHVDGRGARVREESGTLVPAEVEREAVTNHHGEVYALLCGLEALPDGWSGRVCSDSLNALRVFCGEGKLNQLPRSWWPRIGAVLRRLGNLEAVLHKGHPTRRELLAGVATRISKRDGAVRSYPVSEHNARADQLCGERCRELETAANRAHD